MKKITRKRRLDARLSELFPEFSKTQLQSWIVQGKVFVDDIKQEKPGQMVSDEARIDLRAEQPRYVCRAGLKLEKALEHFAIDVTGLTILDAGLSTGGFTDCLLQRGARKIYGVDVGYGQVHEKIRTDPRVVVLERTNLREYKHQGDPIDLVTLDLSFISILKIMPVVSELLRPGGQLVTLIKPQFEAERGQVPRGGVIKDAALRDQIVQRVVAGIQEYGFECKGLTESPITGTSGNVEYLAYFTT